ncbi:hypothetical protein [Pseudonocardia sp. NPDC046786]|uniref:hypothetical protein n=1 Tax=Pseudonocardia sp. NPDC046786 TaxID=3155471 RepID=UPI0033EAC2BB
MTGIAEQSAALRRLVERLDDTAGALVAVRGALAAAWDDPAGREWTDRLDLVRRATDRLAADAVAERQRLDGCSEQPEPGQPEPGPAGPAAPPLPGVTGTRTTDRRGVVAPLLPPLGPDPGR